MKIKTLSAYTNPIMFVCLIPVGLGYIIGAGSYMAMKSIKNVMEEEIEVD